MDFILEILFETFIEGLFFSIQYFVNNIFRNKLSDRTSKIISGILTALIIIAGIIIIITIIDRLTGF